LGGWPIKTGIKVNWNYLVIINWKKSCGCQVDDDAERVWVSTAVRWVRTAILIFFSFVAMLSMAALLKLGDLFCWRLSGWIPRLLLMVLWIFCFAAAHRWSWSFCGTALFLVSLSLGFLLGFGGT
jgi:hypothetical protein